jgi:rubrerythrin
MKRDRLTTLILESLEHERGGVMIYEAALQCALNQDLKKEWLDYLQQTKKHVRVLEEVCAAFGLDPEQETPCRQVVRWTASALVEAIRKALATGDPTAAQLFACESVVLAETKDHLDWELLSAAAEKLSGSQGEALGKAVQEVEEEEDEHVYHAKGWCRELWLECLGLRAVLPPPEERKDVKTAIGAARAAQARSELR